MMLSSLRERVKQWFEEHKSDLLIVVSIVLVAILSFSIGRLSVTFSPKEPIRIEKLQLQNVDEIGKTNMQNGGVVLAKKQGIVVASKNGEKYHLPDCPGAKRIKEENKIWFASIKEAREAGYEPASNCPGLN